MASASALPHFLRIAERPKLTISGRDGETFELKAGVQNAMIYVQDCKNCEALLQQKAMKIFLEGCTDCVVNINNSLLAGTMELLRCQNITLNFQENGQIMTLTAEDTNNLKINTLDNEQFDIIYIYHTTDMEISIGGEHPTNFPVLLTEGSEWQYVIQWLKEGDSKKLLCEKVIREGIYPTTERQRR